MDMKYECEKFRCLLKKNYQELLLPELKSTIMPLLFVAVFCLFVYWRGGYTQKSLGLNPISALRNHSWEASGTIVVPGINPTRSIACKASTPPCTIHVSGPNLTLALNDILNTHKSFSWLRIEFLAYWIMQGIQMLSWFVFLK